jgi:hypothetical protein
VNNENSCLDTNNIEYLINNINKFDTFIYNCGKKCWNNNNQNDCYNTCLTANIKLNNMCTNCFSQLFTCTINNCYNEDIKFKKNCTYTNCAYNFKKCSGLDILSIKNNNYLNKQIRRRRNLKNNCLTEKSIKIIHNNNNILLDEIYNCGINNIYSISECLNNNIYLDIPCSNCFEGLFKCSINSCMTYCINKNSPGCYNCIESKCSNNFNTCSGIEFSNIYNKTYLNNLIFDKNSFKHIDIDKYINLFKFLLIVILTLNIIILILLVIYQIFIKKK